MTSASLSVRHDGQHPRLEKIAVEYLANE